jgi:rSAM/selenodomain-associated transferase 1
MRAARRQLVVLARWPAPGRCKRRLAASCGSSSQAAAMQKRLSWHTLQSAAAAVNRADAQLVLAAAGLGPRALRRWAHQLLPPPTPLTLQRQVDGSLGCRMQRQLQRGFSAGCEQVVLIGSDLPTLDPTDLEEAFARLEHTPLVVGPASDGGYWLIGLNRSGFDRCGAALMSGIAWGSDQVLATTLARATDLQLPVALLREQSDLDRQSALEPWLLRAGRQA